MPSFLRKSKKAFVFSKSRNEMDFSTLFDNQVLLIARLFLASILSQFCDNFFLSMLELTCSMKIQRSVSKNFRFPVIRGQTNDTSYISASWTIKELFSPAKCTLFQQTNMNLCQLRVLQFKDCAV